MGLGLGGGWERWPRDRVCPEQMGFERHCNGMREGLQRPGAGMAHSTPQRSEVLCRQPARNT